MRRTAAPKGQRLPSDGLFWGGSGEYEPLWGRVGRIGYVMRHDPERP